MTPEVQELLSASQAALHEMCHTTAPRDSFTDAVDRLDSAIGGVLNTIPPGVSGASLRAKFNEALNEYAGHAGICKHGNPFLLHIPGYCGFCLAGTEPEPKAPIMLPDDSMTTLRDQFANAALSGITLPLDLVESNYSRYPKVDTDSNIARRCYQIADAMLKARKS